MMSALRITAIFLTILVLHNNYVSGRPDGQLSTDEAENVTETVTEESVTGDEGLNRRKRMVAEEEDPEEDGSSIIVVRKQVHSAALRCACRCTQNTDGT